MSADGARDPRLPLRRSERYPADYLFLPLIRLALRRWYGSVIILLIWAGAACAAFYFFGHMLRRPTQIGELWFRVLISIAFIFLILQLGLVQHFVRRPRREWRNLNAAGRVMRATLTVLMTVIFAAPFVWTGWLMLAR